MSGGRPTDDDLPADPAGLAALALRCATEAAAMVRERRGSRDAGEMAIDTKSTDTDLVTDLDRASDELLRRLLLDARPDDGLVSEEDSDHAGTTGVVWLVDPIDGTTNFVYAHPPYCVSVAATVGGRPVAGAVVEIASDDRYWASLRGGAFRNGAALGLTGPPPVGKALIATGFGYAPARRQRQAEVVSRVIGQIRDIRRLGAASFDLCAVATQRVDGYYEHGLSPWDVAAGEIVAIEAGAAVESLAGGPLDVANGVLAAHPALIGRLREVLLASGAGEI